jgi:hypothetical protein
MRIGRGKQRTQRKPAQTSLSLPKSLHELTWDQTQATVVEEQSVWMVMKRENGLPKALGLHKTLLETENIGNGNATYALNGKWVTNDVPV